MYKNEFSDKNLFSKKLNNAYFLCENFDYSTFLCYDDEIKP